MIGPKNRGARRASTLKSPAPRSRNANRGLAFRGASRGFFLLEGKLELLAAFNHRIHRDVKHLDARGLRTTLYVNNFIFVSADNRACPPLMR
jgi:hypothetical protein